MRTNLLGLLHLCETETEPRPGPGDRDRDCRDGRWYRSQAGRGTEAETRTATGKRAGNGTVKAGTKVGTHPVRTGTGTLPGLMVLKEGYRTEATKIDAAADRKWGTGTGRGRD